MDTVACPSCGEENPSRFKLCGFCGTSLAPVPETIACPSCGEENPSKFRLCGFCGTVLQVGAAGAAGASAPVAPAPVPPVPAAPSPALPPSEVRKLVTLVFTDLKDSTALTASIDAEAMNEIKARYFSAMAAEIERYGGKVEKNIGDAIMAVFGRVRAREDDALRGVQAAYSMVSTLHDLNEEFARSYGVQLTVRTGVNTGEVVANTDEHATMNLATGDAVNVAARLEQNAPANEVLIGDITYALVKDNVEAERVELMLKGKTEPVPAYRLLSVKAVASAAIRRDEPIVGRQFELDLLGGAFAQVVDSASARLVAVIGDAGLGKTRLIADFVGRVSDRATVFRGRCLSYGDGITFWPLTEIVRAAAKIVEDDSPDAAKAKIGGLLGDNPERDAIVERVASAVGLSSASFPVGEIFWGARKLLESQAASRPVVVVIDDIHSAEATFLEFLEHLVETVRGSAMLILCSARPDLLVDHGEWADQADMERIELKPLDSGDVEAMIDRLLGDVTLSAETRERVVVAAEGNPLYVEQMVSMVKEHDGGGEIIVPPTINALLAARLDNLTREERAVVEPASVIGLVFAEAAVEAMVPVGLTPTVPGHLLDLDRKQFVHPLPADDDPLFRFHHILVRDAAYQSLLKRARANLHERFVAWAEPVNRDRGRETEFEEILGYHLEQAVRYRSELGPLDAGGREIGARAAAKLGSAGRRAFARGDLPAASNLLRRAIGLLSEDDGDRLELLLELGFVLLEDGEFADSLGAFQEVHSTADQVGNTRFKRRAGVALDMHAMFGSEGGGNAAEILERTAREIDWFEEDGDAVGSILGWRLIAAIHGTAGLYEEAAAASQRVIAAARVTGDHRVAARGAAGYAVAALHGPTPVEEAIRECEALAREVAGDRRAEAVIGGISGLLSAMAGDFQRGREMSAQGRKMLLELGPSVTAMTTSTESARIELLADDPVAAEAALSRDLADLEAIGERYFRSTVAGLHAHALVSLNDLDRATSSAELARELAEPDDLEAQILWRSAAGKIAARRGDAAQALEHVNEAVRLAKATVDLVLQAEALRDLGTALVALGRQEEAALPIQEALLLYERKGALAAAKQTRRLLDPATVG